MAKALREAKRSTNWIEPNEEWERAVDRFVRQLCAMPEFLRELEPFAERLGKIGGRAALGALALKLTAPGIPDIYQGDELEYRALVDPDNRRPVDWSWRSAMLRRLMGGSPPDRETLKLFFSMRLLGLRARRPAPFAGGYEPLQARSDACAFLRGGDVLVVVGLREHVSGSLQAPRGRWRDVLRGEERTFGGRAALADVLGEHGVGVFERVGSS
jgi:(1->4)-alpha-D-glucan 1-alpha-D-glucosylmutase